jgi:hypothetical protein
VDPMKAKAIATMKPPTTIKELKSFLGKLSYIRRFISGLAVVTTAFTPLLKNGVDTGGKFYYINSFIYFCFS